MIFLKKNIKELNYLKMSLRRSSRITKSKNFFQEKFMNNEDKEDILKEEIFDDNCELTENYLEDTILQKKNELEKCIKLTKDFTPSKKKRLRNAKASRISRLKKKLITLRLNKKLKKMELELKEAKLTILNLNNTIEELKQQIPNSNTENLNIDTYEHLEQKEIHNLYDYDLILNEIKDDKIDIIN